MVRQRIEIMEIADLDEVMQIERRLFSLPWRESDYRGELESQFSYNLVLRIDNAIVGYACMRVILDEASITTIGIDYPYQSLGFARQLMVHLLQYAEMKRALFCDLEVRVSNKRAISLYQSSGFNVIGLRKKYYPDNHEDALVMRKEFSENEEYNYTGR